MKVIIIGSGTAGWSCAAAFSLYENLDITLIESCEDKSIGVGESTTPLIRTFHEHFNIFTDLNWLEKSNGTLKFTIEFESFLKEKNRKWTHPFYTNRILDNKDVINNINLGNMEFSNKFFFTQQIRNEKFHEINSEYCNLGAYHFDAVEYKEELKKVALNRGVKVLFNDVIKIAQNNEITESITLNNNSTIKADLFIDCTGFNNILFENLETNYESFQDRLFNDTAYVIRLPYKNEKIQKLNTTIGKALSSGWVWQIPLNDSISYGYVHSSKHISKEDAKKELKHYLEESFKYNFEEFNPKRVAFSSGCHKNSWIGNNIAIGLSSFFIEPIESTGIALFQMQIIELSRILESNPNYFFNFQKKYNKEIYQNIISVKNFIEMHYILSNREDSSFWIDSSSIKLNEVQKNIIELYKNKQYEKIFEFGLGDIFGSYAWFLLLLGMDKTSK